MMVTVSQLVISDGQNIRYKFLNNLDAARLLKARNSMVKVDDNDFFKVRGKNVFMDLRQILHANRYVLLMNPDEKIENINWDNSSELNQRLYEIKGFGESGSYAVIFCLHSQCAEKISSLKVKDGIFELDKSIIKYRKFLHTNFKALVEGVTFKITPLGKIEKI